MDVVDKTTRHHMTPSWPLVVLQLVQQLLVAATDDSNLQEQGNRQGQMLVLPELDPIWGQHVSCRMNGMQCGQAVRCHSARLAN